MQHEVQLDDATQSGTCADDSTKLCFPNTGTLTAAGGASVGDGYYIDTLANLQCMPSFGQILDYVGGFPGPLLIQATFRVTPVYKP